MTLDPTSAGTLHGWVLLSRMLPRCGLTREMFLNSVEAGGIPVRIAYLGHRGSAHVWAEDFERWIADPGIGKPPPRQQAPASPTAKAQSWALRRLQVPGDYGLRTAALDIRYAASVCPPAVAGDLVKLARKVEKLADEADALTVRRNAVVAGRLPAGDTE